MTNNRLFPVLLPILLLLVLALGACSDVSPSFGQYFRGRTLDLNIVSLERVPELRYASADGQRHFRVSPSSEGLELVLVQLKVENHTATSAIVSIDGGAAQLLGVEKSSTDRINARPFNVNERAEEVAAPENPGEEPFLSLLWNWFLGLFGAGEPEEIEERQIAFLWNDVAVDGTPVAFQLKKDFGITGWMVFEVPKDTKFTELRWRAGDSLTIDF